MISLSQTSLSTSIAAKYINDAEKIPFSPSEYSRFKYGSKEIARKYGYELAEAFIVYLKKGVWEEQLKQNIPIVVISSPYCFIPTATFAMKDYFIQRLNSFLISKNFPVVEETKINRTITYKEDYGELSFEQRLNLIKNDSFTIDNAFCRGKLCIFLDDIRITGSHELVIKNMLSFYRSKNSLDFIESHCMFLYYAILTNSDIPPQIENYLNYYSVKTLKDLDKIINNEDFLLNTRTVKFILNYEHKECKEFFDYQRNKFLTNLYFQAIGNSYHLIPEYSLNLQYLKKLIQKPWKTK